MTIATSNPAVEASAVANTVLGSVSQVESIPVLLYWFIGFVVLGAIIYWRAHRLAQEQRLRAQVLASMRNAEQEAEEQQLRQQMSTRKVFTLKLPDCTTFSGNTSFLKGVLPDEYLDHILHVVAYKGAYQDMKPELASCVSQCYEAGLVRGSKTLGYIAGRYHKTDEEQLYIILTRDLRSDENKCIPWCYLC